LLSRQSLRVKCPEKHFLYGIFGSAPITKVFRKKTPFHAMNATRRIPAAL
jgi:hypothetical protein